jgi:hypothetical protein
MDILTVPVSKKSQNPTPLELEGKYCKSLGLLPNT